MPTDRAICDVCRTRQAIGVVTTTDDILTLCVEHARPYAEDDFLCFEEHHAEEDCPLYA
jgi:hypothetical protein